MRKLVAVMFTDIEGYSAIMQDDEHLAGKMYEIHRTAVKKYVTRQHGEIVQFMGDGSLSVFTSTVDAIECAIALQVLFNSDTSVPVRIGIHQGEVVFTNDNLYGDTVNIASRIESLAKAGSVFISEQVFLQVANKKNIGTALFGLYHFKNIRHPLKIYAIDHPGLLVPRTVNPGAKLQRVGPAMSLPTYKDDFIGRNDSLDQLASIIKGHPGHIISIMGPGGLGKTRLSIEVSKHMKGLFRDGIIFVSLDQATEADQIPALMGQALGLMENAELSWTEIVKEHLQNKNALLVLDNLEHVVEGAVFLEDLVSCCPLITILCTTRKSLDLECEIEFPLSILDLPQRDFGDEVLSNECILLFTRRAQKMRPDFQVTRENYDAVSQICQYLDGLPLAIELAAARVKMLPVEAIVTHLDDIFKILKSAKKSAKRHQTIFETIKWSYDLLTEQEQTAFAAYSIIPGEIGLEVAESVLPDSDAFEMIESLLNHSLLQRSTRTQDVSYFMLRVVREFGQEMLRQMNLYQTKQNSLAHYIFEVVVRDGGGNDSAAHRMTNRLLEDQLILVKFGLDYWLNKNRTKAKKMLLRVWRYYLRRGFIREAFEKVSQLLQDEQKVDDDQAKLLVAQGTLCHNLGRFSQSRNAFSSALNYYTTANDKKNLVATLNHLSWAEFRLGNFNKSESHAESALNQARQIDDQVDVARALNNLGWVSHFRGHYSQACGLFGEVLTIREQIDDRHGIPFAKINKAWSDINCGMIDGAEGLIEAAIGEFANLKNRQLYTFSYLVKACAEMERMQNLKAREILDRICIPNFTEIGDSWGLAMALQKMTEIYLWDNSSERVLDYLDKSLEIRSRNKDMWGIAMMHLLKAHYFAMNGDFFESKRNIEMSRLKAWEMESDHILADLDGLSAKILADQKQYEQAAGKIRSGLAYLTDTHQVNRFKDRYHAVITILSAQDFFIDISR